jgi:hypothetical protein
LVLNGHTINVAPLNDPIVYVVWAMNHSNLKAVILAGEIVNANAQLQLMGIDVTKSIHGA